MEKILNAFATKSELQAVVIILIFGVLDGVGWLKPGFFDMMWPVLAGYAGLRITGKVGRAAMNNHK